MQNLLVSLNNNIVKLTLLDKTGIKGTTAEVSHDIIQDSTILSVDGLAQKLKELLTAEFQLKDKNTLLNILVEPQDTYVLFLTVSKKSTDLDAQIMAEVQSRLDGVSLESLYFSYQKIAPFVYQFVGIKKELMQKYLELSTTLGLQLHSVVPWILTLPKYINKNEPCIFISKNQTDQIVALSELNGIYFSAVYEKEKTLDELQTLVKELSVYKREVPINKIYTVSTEFFSLDTKCEVISLKPEGLVDYDLHMIYFSVVSADNAFLTSQANALTLLPLPQVQTKNKSLVYVGAGVGVAVILLAVLTLSNSGKQTSNQTDQMALESSSANNVLSEQVTPQETTPSVKVLTKADIKVKVLNGAGTAGVAAKGKEFLTKAGYSVTEIGNADDNRSNTLVMLKKSTEVLKDTITADLKGTYEAVFETSLEEIDPFGAIIIVGAK